MVAVVKYRPQYRAVVVRGDSWRFGLITVEDGHEAEAARSGDSGCLRDGTAFI